MGIRGFRTIVELGGLGLMIATLATRADAQDRRPVTAELAAQSPAPGGNVPGAIDFVPGTEALTFLLPESPEILRRVLWQADRPGVAPRIIARPPGEGDTDATLSREEALRRERQRQYATGLTQAVRAKKADLRIIPLGGDLYFQKSDGPLQRLTETPAPELDPQPDPDGRRVAFVREGELYVLEIATKQETRLSQGATDGITNGLAEFIAQEELDREHGFWWSPDGKHIAYQQTDERHIPLYTITHQGSEEFSIETHRYPFAGASNAKVRLGVVPVTGGDTRWLSPFEPDEDAYLARVQWEDPTHLLVQILSRDQTSLKLYRYDLADGSRTLLIEERSNTWVDLHDDLHVIEGAGELLWSSERTGFRHLQLHDRDGKLLRELTSGDWAVETRSAISGLRGVVAVDAKRREVWFQANKEGPTELHLYRVSLDGGPVERLTQEPGYHLAAAVSGDHERFAVISSTVETPSRTTIRDRAGKVLGVLADAADDPRVTSVAMPPPELVTFKNQAGVPLHGAYYAPRNVPAGAKAPLIVITYGGPTAQRVTNSWGMTADLMAHYLAEHGYAVWKLDNRGSSRRGRAFQDVLYRRLGEIEVDDQAEGVRFLASTRPEIDASRVGITGRSYGGYLTLRCLERAPDVFKAGVAVAPVTFWEGYDTAYTERYLDRPSDNSAGYHASSVLAHAADLKGKVLLVHGMLDENVHFRHTARLVSALIDAEKPFDLLPLPQERHGPRRAEGRKYLIERTRAFFDEALRLPNGKLQDK